MKQVRLYNGVVMPAIGYGVFQIPREDTRKAVGEALETGYRMVDTAAAYFNEKEVGEAIRESGIKREKLFVTTKLWVQDYEYEDALKAFDRSMENLGLDYLDLYLLHKPYNNYYAAWRALEKLYKEGRVRAIGVTSFTDERLLDLMLYNEIKPMVNQVETNPYFPQVDTHDFLAAEGIQQEAWSPFAEGKEGLFTNPVLTEIAGRHGKTVGQVILRWHNQRNVVVIPKTVRKERMAENLNIFDFTLTDAEMNAITALDKGKSVVFDANDLSTPRFIHNLKIH